MPISANFIAFTRAVGEDLTPMGVTGYALSKSDALTALEMLQSADVAVLGIDVIRHHKDGSPEYSTTEFWVGERLEEHSFSRLCRLTLTGAEEYLRAFPDQTDARFLLTVCDRERWAELGRLKKVWEHKHLRST